MKNAMRQMNVTDSGAAEAALDTLAHSVVMVQMPTVFVLLAPPNSEGVAWLDRTKRRLPGKNYGTALGSLETFYSMAARNTVPPELDSVNGMRRLTGAFIRIEVAPRSFSSPMVREGTHQGLLLEGAHRALFLALEAGLRPVAEPALLGGHRSGAPLCTSANISGHPAGSIISWERARQFGTERGVPLVLRCDPTPALVGSYPIFWLQRERIRLEREGPGMESLRAALPAHLFAPGIL
jgi:tRNA A37 threonylcarbamoyladenosine synthetase subunit TsaC/SUA5/YrdC